MNSNSNQLIAEYIILVEAAYSDFSWLNYSQTETNRPVFKRTEHNAIMYEYPETKEKLSDRPQAFAQYVTSHYDVVAHWKDRGKLAIPAKRNQSSGFSATLFREGETGKKKPQPAQIYPGHARHLGRPIRETAKRPPQKGYLKTLATGFSGSLLPNWVYN